MHFLLIATAVCWGLATYMLIRRYHPSQFTQCFLGILVLNLSVYLALNVFGTLGQFEWFAASHAALVSGRYYTLLTSMFLHAGMLHLTVNMISYATAFGFLRKIFGTKPVHFLGFCLITGVLSALVHCLTSTMPAVGFSGVILGLFAIIGFYSPTSKLYIAFVFPIGARNAICGLILFSIAAYHYHWIQIG